MWNHSFNLSTVKWSIVFCYFQRDYSFGQFFFFLLSSFSYAWICLDVDLDIIWQTYVQKLYVILVEIIFFWKGLRGNGNQLVGSVNMLKDKLLWECKVKITTPFISTRHKCIPVGLLYPMVWQHCGFQIKWPRLILCSRWLNLFSGKELHLLSDSNVPLDGSRGPLTIFPPPGSPGHHYKVLKSMWGSVKCSPATGD